MKKIIVCLLVLALWFDPLFVSFAQEEAARVSLDFRNAPIQDVLRVLAKQSGLNIVTSEEVSGEITVHLDSIPVSDALDAVITINGFSYTRKGQVVKVTTPEEAEQEKSFIRVVQLVHITSIDAWVALREIEDIKRGQASAGEGSMTIQEISMGDGFLIGNVKIGIDENGNAITLYGPPDAVREIEAFLKEIDQPTTQVLIEALLVETTLNRGETMGVNWTPQATLSGAKRAVTFPFKASGGEEELDEYYPQATPAKDQTTVGSFPSWGTGAFPEIAGLATPFPFATAAEFAFGSLDFSAFQSVVSFLKSREETRLISHPRIVTMNNRVAQIHIGDEVPIPEFTVDDNTGELTISGYEYREAGVLLTVKPTITANKKIKLQVHPEVSTYTNQLVGNSAVPLPIFSTRNADVTVEIEDGYTLVIGGLVKKKTDSTVRKVPILGSIPFIGRAFRYNAKNQDTDAGKTELFIFITVHILTDAKRDMVTQKSLRKLIKKYKIDVSDLIEESRRVIRPKREMREIKEKR